MIVHALQLVALLAIIHARVLPNHPHHALIVRIRVRGIAKGLVVEPQRDPLHVLIAPTHVKAIAKELVVELQRDPHHALLVQIHVKVIAKEVVQADVQILVQVLVDTDVHLHARGGAMGLVSIPVL